MAVSKLAAVSPELFEYWAHGKGKAKWITKPHPWTALRNALVKAGVPAHEADGLATNIMLASADGKAAYYAHHGGKKRHG